ncbi:PP2C family protein-serine/threonine phosphatase [Kitasatospora sp. NPDC088346]|uniref:PP2C family protein-serine/threonine phosphatase n=1 Tax=Kitasatospora sp. NPDC088346 TaxID=3364073 RepID=UPI0037FBCFE3
MTGLDVDYAAAFRAAPSPMLVLTPDLIMVDANDAYLQVSGRTLAELVGRYLFDVFPDNPAAPAADGVDKLRASLARVLRTGQRDSMALHEYDVEPADHSGAFEERYWSTVNTPVLDVDGTVKLILHRVEEVTALVRQLRGGRGRDGRRRSLTREEQMAADLLARGQELQEVNEQLRDAHAREREVAVTLQRALLPSVQAVHRDFAAVRYLPATSSMNVCGDWYDLLDLDERHVAVAVGDVVGHGIEAAGVMGRLNSALNAAIRATCRPAEALKTLALFALTVEGALATTAVQTVIDRTERTVTYSCAGHPPPVLVEADGTSRLLDGATDPPLGAWDDTAPRSQAVTRYRPGATLILYTDGLVERRGEDIDVGLARLTAGAVRHRALGPERIADALLAELAAGSTDDTALVVVRL